MLKPDKITVINGVKVNEKLIPTDAVWTDKERAKESGKKVGDPYISAEKLSGGTGQIKGVTIHNTDDLENVDDDAEQYVRATWPNQNMGNVRVHYYVDDNGAWQMLPLDTVGFHAGDIGDKNGGNKTTVAIEVIMSGRDKDSEKDEKAEDNAARIAAQILFDNGLTVDQLYTHTYWINRREGAKFEDGELQKIYYKRDVYKYCPIYILPHWVVFEENVKKYLEDLKKINTTPKKKVGDIVYFKGGSNYRQSNSESPSGGVKNAGKAVVTSTAEAKHPYHIKPLDGGSATAYGWVDEFQIK